MAISHFSMFHQRRQLVRFVVPSTGAAKIWVVAGAQNYRLHFITNMRMILAWCILYNFDQCFFCTRMILLRIHLVFIWEVLITVAPVTPVVVLNVFQRSPRQTRSSAPRYWWSPDSQFALENSSHVQFPPHSRLVENWCHRLKVADYGC